jgi:proteasome alpha subunit
MFTPYDWQEGIGNRAQYIEGKLQQGAPVLAVSVDEGIMVFTYRRQARKIYEIYDRLVYAGVGQQSDVEAIRVAALEFASREGFNRSEEDVTIQRVATAMSTAVKRAFSDFSTAPLVARSMFAEVNATPAEDVYYVLDFDGDYAMYRQFAVVAGTEFAQGQIIEKMRSLPTSLSADQAVKKLEELWNEHRGEEEQPKDLKPEAVLLERSAQRENRFRLLFPEEF